MTRNVADVAIRDATVPLVSLTIDRMRVEFERVKAEYDLPDDAVPQWSIRWYYFDTRDEGDE